MGPTVAGGNKDEEGVKKENEKKIPEIWKRPRAHERGGKPKRLGVTAKKRK